MWKPTISSDEIYHHGILGQRYGKRNGPPYPLGSGAHSSEEKKHGWKQSLKAKDTKTRHKELAKKYKPVRKKNEEKEESESKKPKYDKKKEDKHYRDYRTAQNKYEDALKDRNGLHRYDADKYKKQADVLKKKIHLDYLKALEEDMNKTKYDEYVSRTKLYNMSKSMFKKKKKIRKFDDWKKNGE